MNQELEEDTCDYYLLGEKDYIATNPVNWLSTSEPYAYNHLPSLCIPVPQSVLTYLRNPNFRLPSGMATSGTQGDMARGRSNDDISDNSSQSSWCSMEGENPPSFPPSIFAGQQFQCLNDDADNDANNDTNNDSNNDDGENDNEGINETDITAFESVLRSSIFSLGGSVIPKLNWKAPRDARWIGFNKSLKCFMPGDILLLLKSSNIIDNILSEPIPISSSALQGHGDEEQVLTSSYNLTLFQWNDSFSPEFEFRCFVASRKLILISQRDDSQGFPSIGRNRDNIIFDIYEFFRKSVYPRFPLEYYVFDVIRSANGVVTLIDFNVFGLPTEPNLTSYKELKLLISETEGNIIQGGADRLSSGGERKLKERNKYGSPYFRYLSGSGVEKAHPLIQAPLPVDVVTYFRNNQNLDTQLAHLILS